MKEIEQDIVKPVKEVLRGIGWDKLIAESQDLIYHIFSEYLILAIS